jgi:hypothetical protein
MTKEGTMGALNDYYTTLTPSDIKRMYGAAFDFSLHGIYGGLIRFADPPRGDLLIVTRLDAKLLRDGEVIERFSDKTKSGDAWRRQGSDFTFDDDYTLRMTLRLYLRDFPLVLERDLFIQRYMQVIYNQPTQLIVKLLTP